MQLYCNYNLLQLYSNIGEWSNATILQLMQLYATILQLMQHMQLYATILQQYATYATILQQFRMQLYATMQLCNFMQLQQLYGTYATLRNFMQLYCNYMQLPKNVYWHDNLSSCFNECRYHQIGICRIYLPRVMIKI
jgi:hypothetical protein